MSGGMSLRVALGLSALNAVGCGDFFGDQENYPGDRIGRFAVTAQATQNECGQGVLTGPEQWAFEVVLSRAEGELFWDNGQEIIPGQLAEDGVSFGFETGVLVDMRTDEDPKHLPPCAIFRRDHASGQLSSAEAQAASFDGALAYHFEVTAESDCNDLLAATPPLATQLPCDVAYAMVAERIGDE
jgi:hypothetical protein